MPPTATMEQGLVSSPTSSHGSRQKYLKVTTASDTDSASDNGSCDESMVTSVPSLSWKRFQAVEHQQHFTSGTHAILHVAGNMSDSVFLYPLLQPSINVSTSLRAHVVTLDIQQGAGTAVRGVLATGMRASAMIPSQTLPLFLPSLFQIAQEHQPAVFHVSCESLRSDLAVCSSYEALYALQHSGAILLNSSSPQECHDMAVIAHVTAQRLQRLVVHFYDGSRVAHEQTTLRLLTPSALTAVASVEPFPSLHDTAEQVQDLMQALLPVLEHPYRLYEYHGAIDATNVIVVMGEVTSAIQQAVAYEQMLGRPVGVVQVRMLLPWSHQLFSLAIPSTTERVAVLENMSPNAFIMQQGLLTQSVQVFFHSDQWKTASYSVLVRTGLYGGAFTHGGFTIGMGRAVFHHLQETKTRRSFLIVSSETAEERVERGQLDVIYGEGFEVEGNEGFTKQLIWWGYDVDASDTTIDLLRRNPSTQVHAIVNHSVPSPTSPPVVTTQVQLSRAGTRVVQQIQESHVSIVLNLELFSHVNVLASVRENGIVLVNANWKTMDDVEDVMSRLWVKELAAKRVHLWVIDVNDVQQRVTKDTIANVAASIAFFKATGLYNERVVYTLLASQFPVEGHSTLRSFVSSVWGETLQLFYRPYTPESVSSEESVATLPGATLASLSISKVPHSSTKPISKRTRPDISKETSLAWKLLFPEQFHSRQGVRDHVTDIVRVTKWERLTPESYERNVFHMEMDITNTKIQYSIGEALAVFAHNDEKDVLTLLQLYGVEADSIVTIPCVSHHKGKGAVDEPVMEETLTYYQLFAQVLDLCGRPSKKFYESLARVASDDKEKQALMRLVNVEGKEEYKARVEETITYLDLLLEFPSARPTMDQLITWIPRIKPRHYSIASSMKTNPTSVHLLIVVHDWTTPKGTYRIGQATRFLRTVRPGQLLSVSVCSSVMKLPVNPQDPIIMAGLGTGMAPFRAFIQERSFLKAKGIPVGPIALYFGSRNRANEFLYGEELEQYEQDGLLTYLRCAFSRDQAHKIYIQDKIAEDKEILADWLIHKNAHFYLCGPTWPVADVREALMTALTSTSIGVMDRKQANEYIEMMREQGRYVLEVY